MRHDLHAHTARPRAERADEAMRHVPPSKTWSDHLTNLTLRRGGKRQKVLNKTDTNGYGADTMYLEVVDQ
jgi:hypothetical protein